MSLEKNISFNYIFQVFTIGINFVYSLIIVHQLGASGYGEFSIFFNSIAFAILLFGFNLQGVIVFFTANKIIEPGKLLFSSIAFVFITAAILAVLLSFSGELNFSQHVFPGGNNKSIWIFFFTAMFLLLQLNQILAGFLNANKIFIPISFFSFLCNSALIIFWICIIFKLINIPAERFNLIWWASIIMNSCIALYAFWLIKKRVAVNISMKLLSIPEVKIISAFIVIVYLCNTIQFMNYKMDIWFINYFVDDAHTGVYSLAISLSQLIWILPNTISAVLLNYFQVKQRESSIKMAVTYAQLSFYFSCITAFVLLVIYYFAIPAIYGAEFSDTFLLCAILFLGAIPFSLSIIIANLNTGIGFVKINLYATVFVFLVGLMLDVIVIPKYGMIGAAIVKAGVYNLGLVFQLIMARKLYNLQWTNLFKLPGIKNIFKFEAASQAQ